MMMNSPERNSGPRLPVPTELMKLSDLCDHLSRRTHFQLEQQLRQLERVLFKGCPGSPGKAGAHLRDRTIQARFREFRHVLLEHLQTEVETVFPLIRTLDKHHTESEFAWEQLHSILARMKREHAKMDEAFAELETLVEEAAMDPEPRRTVMEVIDRMDDQLQNGIYCENQILYRRARALGRSQ